MSSPGPVDPEFPAYPATSSREISSLSGQADDRQRNLVNE